MTDATATGESTGVAWIVGVGSATGLGAALARRCAAGGLSIAITGRNAARLESVRTDINRTGACVHALPGDASSASDIERLAAQVRRLGVLRVAIFNAGNMVRGTPLQVTPQQFEATWRGSAYAGFLFARAALEPLLAGGGGTLLFTGATASVRGRGPFVAFAAAKAALRSLAQSCAREYGARGVHVAHVVIDGGIDGEQLRAGTAQRGQGADADALLHPDAIAETYWQLHVQPRSAWTHELDLRSWRESF